MVSCERVQTVHFNCLIDYQVVRAAGEPTEKQVSTRFPRYKKDALLISPSSNKAQMVCRGYSHYFTDRCGQIFTPLQMFVPFFHEH